jgi:hypothetical protein
MEVYATWVHAVVSVLLTALVAALAYVSAITEFRPSALRATLFSVGMGVAFGAGQVAAALDIYGRPSALAFYLCFGAATACVLVARRREGLFVVELNERVRNEGGTHGR